MSEKSEKNTGSVKTAHKTGKQSLAGLNRSLRGLERVTKALKQLSAVTAALSTRTARASRSLRTLLSFDEINRLNPPASRSSRRRRKASRRKSGRRRSTRSGRSSRSRRTGGSTRKRMGLLERLRNRLGKLWKNLRKFLSSKKTTVLDGFQKLIQGAEKLRKRLKEAFSRGYERVIKPLKEVGGSVLDSVREDWENILKLMEDQKKHIQWVMDDIADLWDKAVSAGGRVREWLSGLVSDTGQWVQDKIVAPFQGIFTVGLPGVWSNVKELFATNPTLKANVQLVKDGWNTVSGWVKDHIGSGVSKAIALAKDSWSSVAGWVRDHIGGGVSKSISLAKDGWSSVSGWVKDRLGKGVKFAIGLAKGWKGSVAKKLGLDKLSSTFKLKLPKVSVTWSGKPIPLPHFHVKWNAKGGILDGAQLFGMAGSTLLGGGERGREAVLPLESNTGWMDTLADKVAARVGGQGGSNQPIRVQVVLDGKVVAESTVRQLRNQARGGNYPLAGLV